MADKMTFPENFMDFIKIYSFKGKREIYTNGSNLILVLRVEQSQDHYSSQIENAINNIKDCYQIICNNISNINTMMR